MNVKRIRGRRLQAIREEHLCRNPFCERCKAKGLRVLADEVDHIVPLAKGGADAPGNRQSLCEACHKAKTAEDFGHTQRQRIGVDGFPITE